MLNKNKILYLTTVGVMSALSPANAQTFYQCIPNTCPSGQYFDGSKCINIPQSYSCPKNTTYYKEYCFYNECDMEITQYYEKNKNPPTPTSIKGVSATYVSTDYFSYTGTYLCNTQNTNCKWYYKHYYKVKLKFGDCINDTYVILNTNTVSGSPKCCANPVTPIASSDMGSIMGSIQGGGVK